MKPNKKRAVITGVGVVAPNGNNLSEYTEALKSGKSGIGITTHFDPETFKAKLSAEVKNFDNSDYLKKFPDLSKTRDFKIFLGLKAFEECIKSSGLNDLSKASLNLGTSLETFFIKSLMELSPEKFAVKKYLENYYNLPDSEKFYLQTPVSYLGELLLKEYNLKGPVYTNCSACTASTQAIGKAFDWIADDREKVVITGGFDSLINPLGIGGFSVLGALNTDNDLLQEASMPFDIRRKGIVIGEGAAVFVLEELEHALERGADIYAEILGYHSTLDAYKFSSPPPDGYGIARAMETALKKSGISPEQIDYINAHGTSTILNDVTETIAIKTVFAEKAYDIPVSSIKSMIGHLVGASGAVELAGCIQMIREGFISPTINLKTPDPECDLNYVPGNKLDKELNYVLKNSMGFGGQNTAMVIKKYNS